MARTPNTQQWPPYPHIPIYLETSGHNGTARSYRSISPMAPSPEIHTEKPTLQYLAAASAQFTNISTNVSPVSPATQFTNLSPVWPIPEPMPAPPPEVAQQPPRRPALRFSPTSRPRVQLEEHPREQLEKAHRKSPNLRWKSRFGLGIDDVCPPMSPASIPSSDSAEVDKRSSNIAQRIEEGLWRYSLSGNVIKRWALEILCWCLSAISMGTIIGFLIYYKDKKIPNWPGSLTLNALIAVLSKVSGAALILPVSEALGQLKWSWFQGHSKTMWDFEIFDNASRGPWGSFLLLIRTKGKALAALGAIITLFSLALDPFFQQVVDFPDRWVVQLGKSSLPIVVRYEPRYPVETRLGIALTTNDPEIFAVTKKFFYENGTQPVPFGNGTRPDISVSCPTGNCTWPTYQTLGVCSKCADVSDLLTFACLNITVDWVANLTGAGSENTYPNGTMCGYFFNATSKTDTPVMMSGYLTDAVHSVAGQGSAGEALLTRILPLASNPAKLPVFGGSIRFKNVRNPLMDFVVASAANGIEGVYRNETPVALECVVSWCVKTIQSTYFQATYEETVIDVFENDTAADFPWRSTFPAKDIITWYTEDIVVEAPSIGNESNIIHYGLTNDTFIQVSAPFDDAFPSTITAHNSTEIPTMRYKQYIRGLPYWRDMDFNPWSGSNNIQKHVERMATAMTNVIRSTSNSTHVTGDASFKEAYVSVRWEWLALPLSLLLLTFIFLVATMKKTAKEGVWKTSAIATLLYGLPDDMQKKITTGTKDGTPRAKAKELKVKMDATKGWRISGNLFSPMTPKPRQHQSPPGWI